MRKKILVTGGAGYIGSHTCLVLLQAGYDVVLIDNLSNSSEESIKRVEYLSSKKILFYKGDIRDKDFLRSVFSSEKIFGVIHFAGLKAVGESTEIPLEYYHQNVYGTIVLLEMMKEYSCFNIVFSSSATVYGVPKTVPIKEDFETNAMNPYGRTKLFVEEILKDLANSDSRFHIVLLRYFNPVGAHGSGLIGEHPEGIPNNLMPYISQVAIGQREYLSIFGGDYNTKDGTGVRDYIHVVDLAEAHMLALNKIDNLGNITVLNIGTGRGYSVLEMLNAFKEENQVSIPFKIVGRRDGDIDEYWSDPTLAKNVLGWEAKFDINDMMRDTWNWQSNNPNGYNK